MAEDRRFYGRAPAVAAAFLTLACGDPNQGNDVPLAQFSTKCAALRCDFTDQSTDDESVVAWHWSFGDGASATDQNPFHLNEEPGTYSVTLTVHDVYGSSDRGAQR
jgi:PKD repeat protein